MRETTKSNLSPLALMRLVAEDYIDYYALERRRGSRSAKSPKLPAEEMAELIGHVGPELDEPAAEMPAPAIIDISTHPRFDSSRLKVRVRRPASAPGPEADQARPA